MFFFVFIFLERLSLFVKIDNLFLKSWKYLSWQDSFKNLYRIQLCLYKSLLVDDINFSLALQKVLLKSNSISLIAIREVTQLDILKTVPGCDGRIYLDFSEKFDLNNYLKNNLSNWFPTTVRNLLITKKDGTSFFVIVSTISDRCWQAMLKYSLVPVYEALFSFRNFGFRTFNNIFDLQTLLISNLSYQSFGTQKRLISFDLKHCCDNITVLKLLRKLFLPRNVKLGLFRFFKLGFIPQFYEISNILNFSSVLTNICFLDVDFIHNSLRFGYNLLFFLKPLDNEVGIVKCLKTVLRKSGLNFNYTVKFLSSVSGFQYLDWNFSLSYDFAVICTPSFDNYQSFLRRIKRVVNNSNYSSTIKSVKLFPIIRDWHYYNRFVNSQSLRFSLFFVKRRAFKIFNLESKQDRYSTKFLINKCFASNSNYSYMYNKSVQDDFIKRHVFFCFDYFSQSQSYLKVNFISEKIVGSCSCMCIHCGLYKPLNYFFQ